MTIAAFGRPMDSKTTDSRTHHTPRVEDDALVRGVGRFVADAPEPGQAYAQFVRSPHACARIRAIDIEAAKRVRGVLAVLTGADMDAAGVGNVARHPPIAGRGGQKLVMPNRPALARERVMHVGVAVRNQRLVVATMEPRGASARYDAAADRYELRACSQSAGGLRDNILAIM